MKHPLPSSLPSHPVSISRNRFKKLIAPALAAFVTSAAFAAPSTTIVISQVYGGGGNSGATYKNDFIELHNISGSAVDLTGWSVQYNAATGASAYQVTALSGTIASGAYYLVQEAAGTGGTADLPTPEKIGTIGMAAGAGRIALVNNVTPLAAASVANAAGIVDYVGYGTTADAYEGTGRAPTPSATASVLRKDFGSQDNDNNSSDFITGTVTPRNSSSPTHLPTADTTPPSITSRTPGIAATGVSLNPSVSITFDEPITAGAGSVQLFKEAGAADVLIPIGAVGITGNTASFTPSSPLESGAAYYVLIASNAFTDLATPTPNAYPGIASETTWTFTTLAPPVLDTFAIGNGAANTVTPSATLTYTWSGGAPSEYMASELSDFSDATWTTISATGPVQALSAGNGTKTVYFKIRNALGESAVLSDTTVRASYLNPGTLLITQYYEGDTGFNKYVEITNTTGSPINLSGWHLVRWANEDAGNWKITGTSIGGSSGDIALAGSLAAGQTAVFAHTSAAAPIAAASAFAADNKINHNGNDSYALYEGSVSPENLRDAVAFTNSGNEGADKSFVRISSGNGFDFTAGTSILNYAAVWQQATLATVNAAAVGQNEYLGTYPGGAPTNTFTSWIGAFSVGTETGVKGDFDKDGLSNAVENILGSNPSASNTGLTGVSSTANSVTFQHTRSASPASDLTPGYEWSTDLASWFPAGGSNGSVTVTFGTPSVVAAGPPELIQVTATATGGTVGTLFARLKVTHP
jgi:hypothetical protein